jgi:hypothetical protein
MMNSTSPRSGDETTSHNTLWVILNFAWPIVCWIYWGSIWERESLPIWSIVLFWVLVLSGVLGFLANTIYVFRGDRTVPFIGLVAYAFNTLLAIGLAAIGIAVVWAADLSVR